MMSARAVRHGGNGVHGINWYVDSVAGSDSNTGKSTGQAFATLSHANSVSSANHTIALKRGSTFRETLSLTANGQSIRAYGSGSNPIISGGIAANTSGDWTQVVTDPLPIFDETFETGAFVGAWSSTAGTVVTTKANGGTHSVFMDGASGAKAVVWNGIGGTYSETIFDVNFESGYAPATGNKIVVTRWEGSAWNAANSRVLWAVKTSTGYAFQFGNGSATSGSQSVFALDTWYTLRVILDTVAGTHTLYVGGTQVLQTTGLSLSGGINADFKWGVSAGQTSVYKAYFDNFMLYDVSSVPAGTNNWYLASVSVDPMVVTLNGALGQRKFYLSDLTTSGDYCYSANAQHLYVNSPSGNPTGTWSAIEYSHVNHPIQVTGSNVSLHDIIISHHNLDDGIGVSGTAVLINVTRQLSGTDVVDYTKRPGRQDSEWTAQLTGSETYTAITTGFNSLGFGFSNWTDGGGGFPIYYATNTDPLVNVIYNPNAYWYVDPSSGHTPLWARSGNNSTVETDIVQYNTNAFGSLYNRYQYSTTTGSGVWTPPHPSNMFVQTTTPTQIYCPVGAVPQSEPDGNLIIYQPDGTVFESNSAIRMSNGDIVCLNFNINDPSSTLTGNQGGMRASCYPNYAGLVRAAEATANSIPHVLTIVIPTAYAHSSFENGAIAWDKNDTGNVGEIPSGRKFAIPFSVDLDTIGWSTDIGKAIARAAQQYGLIYTDRGGGSVTLYGEYGATVATGASTDLTTIIGLLQYVS